MCLDQSFKCLDLVLELLDYIAVIFVSDFSSFSKKPLNLTALCSLLETTLHLSAYARMGYEEDNDDADADADRHFKKNNDRLTDLSTYIVHRQCHLSG